MIENEGSGTPVHGVPISGELTDTQADLLRALMGKGTLEVPTDALVPGPLTDPRHAGIARDVLFAVARAASHKAVTEALASGDPDRLRELINAAATAAVLADRAVQAEVLSHVYVRPESGSYTLVYAPGGWSLAPQPIRSGDADTPLADLLAAARDHVANPGGQG